MTLRPQNVRLQIAYICDAVNGGFPTCEPGNSITRLFDNYNTGSHPYMDMWMTIDKYYDAQRWYELSDVEIGERFNTIRSNGDGNITGMDLMRAKQRWESNGWTRYERKRNGRRAIVYKYAPVTVAMFFGVTLPNA